MIVAIERARSFLSFEGHLDTGGIGEVNVRPAVTIVIENDPASAHRLDDVFLRSVRGVLEGDAGLGGDVFELRNWTPAAFGGLGSRRRRRRCGVAALSEGEIRGEQQRQKGLSQMFRTECDQEGSRQKNIMGARPAVARCASPDFTPISL